MILKTMAVRWTEKTEHSNIISIEPVTQHLVDGVTQVSILDFSDDMATIEQWGQLDNVELHTGSVLQTEGDVCATGPVTLLRVFAPQYAPMGGHANVLVDRAWMLNEQGDTIERLTR